MSAPASTPLPDRNLLDGETSPYLRQHADNPVHWRPWGADALAEAKRLDRPILLSVGYAACHWCHVMAHESFENPETADLMNRSFVNIKVDREERPDIDHIYMTALHRFGQQGGWPLTMFLTPDGEPFYGGTYFPDSPKYGQPAFSQVLEQLANVWETKRDEVHTVARQMTAALKQPSAEAGPGFHPQAFDAGAAKILEHIDRTRGGLAGSPKFPMSPMLAFFNGAGLRALETTGTDDSGWLSALDITLNGLCRGGIYDHLGGGFARYSTDADWLVPHFEKMLYDNGLLLSNLARAYGRTGEPLLARHMADTIAFMDRELRAENGAYIASLDADSEGEEGRFYVFSKAEIETVLGPEAEQFCAVYGVHPAGNWEGTNVLALRPDTDIATVDAFARARAKLLAYREKRIRPGADIKVLADWNGYAISGLLAAAAVLNRPDWRDRAQDVFHTVVQDLAWADNQGRVRLAHSMAQGRVQTVDLLEDYGAMGLAALDLFNATGDQLYLKTATDWVDLADTLFADPATGRYFQTAEDASDTCGFRLGSVTDQATPAGVATLLACKARLVALTADHAMDRALELAINAGLPEASSSFPHSAAYISAAHLAAALPCVILVYPQDQAQSEDLHHLKRAVLAAPRDDLSLRLVAASENLPASHPAHGKQPVDDRPTAYYCQRGQCAAPVTDPKALTALLCPGS